MLTSAPSSSRKRKSRSSSNRHRRRTFHRGRMRALKKKLQDGRRAPGRMPMEDKDKLLAIVASPDTSKSHKAFAAEILDWVESEMALNPVEDRWGLGQR